MFSGGVTLNEVKGLVFCRDASPAAQNDIRGGALVTKLLCAFYKFGSSAFSRTLEWGAG